MEHIRVKMRAACYLPDLEALEHLNPLAPTKAERTKIVADASAMVDRLRTNASPSMMELFLREYGLSSDEGIALMCLAEALLRVPDAATMDALIEDKIVPSEWGKHLGESHSILVNASTWALFITGHVLEAPGQGIAGHLRGAIKRLGEPVIRKAVARVMREMGQQFVLGQTIQKATKRAQVYEEDGYSYSYDMLGEAAMNEADARAYYTAYANAISQISKVASGKCIRTNPGISIKLSALHPRYDLLHRDQVMRDLVPSTRSLALLAKSAGIGLNIDAEEAARLDLSLDIIEAVLSDPNLADWDGFGVVVQAYSKRAVYVIDWLYDLSVRLDRRIMVRLVKGAYWDTEIKLAQVEGLPGFTVYGAKHHTDISYICCAAKLLTLSDRIYPQFATHNAHTIAAVLHIAKEKGVSDYEFQRLHGMGEELHDQVLKEKGTRCRIYAPVGHHSDLLAYLVRRLLENGANSSFVNQIFDSDVASVVVAADPFDKLGAPGPEVAKPKDIFAPNRVNSTGFDLADPSVILSLQQMRIVPKIWDFGAQGEIHKVNSPTTGTQIGQVRFLSANQAQEKVDSAEQWHACPSKRANVLRRVADLYESHADAFFALLTHEAGKNLPDCIGELREAIDFLRFYAAEAEANPASPAGIFTCISPWNFPLAIFTGQIAAALASGNGVLAKPAENTSMIAYFAVELMHRAGIPTRVLQLVAGQGSIVGPVLCTAPVVAGVCFTGSTAIAQVINRSMAHELPAHVPLIAETGGLNAMIIDSTALLEQAVRDVLVSAFQSAGQRCSALRVLYVQRDIATSFQTMLFGAMQALVVGDPARIDCDVGPVIDGLAQEKILRHIEQGNVLFKTEAPSGGSFVPPTVLAVSGINDLEEEIFGPVLHFATFEADALDQVIDDINASNYGLTFGFHSRIDDRVQRVVSKIDVGNLYINRNQIGAVVGSQPFGGNGLSGTGPKAGGPRYLQRFAMQNLLPLGQLVPPRLTLKEVSNALNINPKFQLPATVDLPGPTGESNRYILSPRRRVLCMGPGSKEYAERAKLLGCNAVAATLSVNELILVEELDAVICVGPAATEIRKALSARNGPIVPVLMDENFEMWLMREQSVCIDTTAAGGNAALLAS